jgi:hypothetical protein
VVIKEGSKTLATLTLVGGQTLWITPATLTPGLHLLTATYQGDANDLSGIFSIFALTVV